MSHFNDWLHAARPKTLGAAIAPVLVGTAIGRALAGEWHPWLALCTLLSCAALQVATNWFNDAIDFIKGSDTAARLGPQRITASGVVSANQVLTAATLMLGVALLLSLPLIAVRGWPIIAIGLPSLYFCFGYTGGPMPLAYRGLGELFVILFFGFVAVTGSAFVQSGQWHVQALIAGFQIGCLSTVLIAINNLRDRAEDSTTGKRTLAVRFGEPFAMIEISQLIVLPIAMQAIWLRYGHPINSWVWAVQGLLGLLLLARTLLAKGPALNQALALAGMFLVASAVELAWRWW
jgi:1,4-dihydroxy-2-naphthoate polyprenyltransferase